MRELIIKSFNKNKKLFTYLFIQLILSSFAILFCLSMGNDVYKKIKLNSQVMDLGNYRFDYTNRSLEDRIDYDELIKLGEMKDITFNYYIDMQIEEKEGREFKILMINPEFLDIYNFKVTDGKTLTKESLEGEFLVGKNVAGYNVSDICNIDFFGGSINGSVVGILDSENILWSESKIIPSNLDDYIVMFDRELGNQMESKEIFITDEWKTDVEALLQEEYDSNGEDLITVRQFLFQEILQKDSGIYISFIFMIILILISINSISITMSLILEKRQKEFGVKYALGIDNDTFRKEIIYEFYIISSVAYICAVLVINVLKDKIIEFLGYDFELRVAIISAIIYIIITLPIIVKAYRKIKKYTPTELIRGNK